MLKKYCHCRRSWHKQLSPKGPNAHALPFFLFSINFLQATLATFLVYVELTLRHMATPLQLRSRSTRRPTPATTRRRLLAKPSPKWPARRFRSTLWSWSVRPRRKVSRKRWCRFPRKLTTLLERVGAYIVGVVPRGPRLYVWQRDFQLFFPFFCSFSSFIVTASSSFHLLKICFFN